MSDNTAVRAAKLDKIFGTPVCAVLLAIFCNVLWGSAFPFIKLGYRLFSIDSGNTASIFCFAGVRFRHRMPRPVQPRCSWCRCASRCSLQCC